MVVASCKAFMDVVFLTVGVSLFCPNGRLSFQAGQPAEHGLRSEKVSVWI